VPETKTQRSNCRFVVQDSPDGEPVVIVQPYQDTIPIFHRVVMGLALLGAMQPGQARKVAQLLNKRLIYL
jgi:hypothetical protein